MMSYIPYVTTTASSSTSINITTDGSSTTNLIYLPPWAGLGAYEEFNLNKLKQITQSVRDRIVEIICKKSSYFPNFEGICGIASRMLFKKLLIEGCNPTIVYVSNSKCKHIYLTLDDNRCFSELHIIDIAADIYGEEPISIIPESTIDTKIKYWWDDTRPTSDKYHSQAGVVARQKKDGWPEEHISLIEAKKTPIKFVLSDTKTDISQNEIKLFPPDKESEKFLKKHAKGSNFDTTIAKLLLDKNPDIRNLAESIIKIMV